MDKDCCLLSVDLEKMPTYIDVIKFENEAPANTIRLKCRSRNLLPTTFETYSENFVNRQLLIPLGKTQCVFFDDNFPETTLNNKKRLPKLVR